MECTNKLEIINHNCDDIHWCETTVSIVEELSFDL